MFRLVLLIVVLFGIAVPACAQALKVGYIDLERLARESPQGKRIVSTLKEEFAPREQEILRFQAQIKEAREQFEQEKNTLPETERNERGKSIAEMMKKSDRMVHAWQEDAKLRREQMTGEFLRVRNTAINTVIKAGNFDLVLHQAVFNSKRVDITDKVLAEMTKSAGAGGQ